MSDSKLPGHLAMAGANIMWGVMSPLAKTAMAGGVIGSLMLTDMRIFGAAILFWVTSLFRPYEHVPAADLLRLAGAACLAIVFNQGSFIAGVSLSSPGEASIITTTMPMWVMVLAAVILRDPITPRKLLGIALGAAGAITLVFNGASSSAAVGDDPALGDLLVLFAQLSYALYLTLYKNFIRRYSLVTLMKWMFLFASMLLLPVSVTTIAATPWQMVTPLQWGCAGYVVLCGTFLAYCCIMVGQKRLRPTTVGMYSYLQPIVAAILGVILGYDRFTPVKILAVAMIFAGVYIVITIKSRPAEAPSR